MKLEEVKRQSLIGVAAKILRNSDDAEDCVQNALMHVWQKVMVGGVDGERLAAYTVSAVRNEAFQKLRERRKSSLRVGSSVVKPGFDTGVEIAEQVEMVKKKYPAIVDGFTDELSYAEMAAQQHVSVAALKTRIFRMRESLTK